MAHFSVVFSQYLQSNILNRKRWWKHREDLRPEFSQLIKRFLEFAFFMFRNTHLLFYISGMYRSCLVDGNMCGGYDVQCHVCYHLPWKYSVFTKDKTRTFPRWEILLSQNVVFLDNSRPVYYTTEFS